MRYFLLYCFFKTICLYSQIGLSDGYQTIENQDGIKTAEGLISKGLPEGLWINYFVNNKIKSKGFWRGGELDSTWVFYTVEGRLERSISYEHNRKNGNYIIYDTAERILFKGFYVNDTLQGPYEQYENGELIEQGNYRSGQKDGKVLLYQDGNLSEIRILNNGNEGDQIKINQFKNGKKHGKWIEKDSKGLDKEVVYENGDLVDYSIKEEINFYKEINKEGKVISQVVLQNGQKEGYELFFAANGQIRYAKRYKQGELIAEGKMDTLGREDSVWVYYENQIVSCKGNFLEGAKNGKWTYYFTDGKVEQTGYYKSNQLSGTWNWYYPDGTLRSTENYFNGKKEGVQEDYNTQGKLIEREQISYSRKEGEQFYFVGDHLEKGELQNGLRQGVWIYRHANGKKAFKGKYVDGIAEGKHRYWYENGRKSVLEFYAAGNLNGLRVEFTKKGSVLHTYEYKKGELIRFDGEIIRKDQRLGNEF